MWDRAFLFLFSLVMIIAALAGMAWLAITGQADTFDGLFLFCTFGILAVAFGLYLRWMLKSALGEAQAPQPKAAAKAPAAKVTPETRPPAVLQDVH